MHLIVAIIFIITVAIAFVEDYLKDFHKYIILAIYAVVMVYLAATKDILHTADASQYETMFLHNDDFITVLTTEPTFLYLSRIVLACGGTIGVMFLIYALITIPLKLKTLSELTPYIFTALIIYIPIYYEQHDLIQIRAAAAATFLILSIVQICKKKYILATILIICGGMFHYSGFCYLPFVLIGNRQLNKVGRIAVALALPVCFLIYLSKSNLFSLIPSFLTQGKLDFYKDAAEKGEWEEISAPYLNLFFLIKCFVIYLSLYYYDIVVKGNKYAPIIINISAFGVCFLLAMASIPVIGVRIGDMYSVVDCILCTFAIYIIAPRYLARLLVVAGGLFMLIYNMVNTEYFI